MKAFRVVQLIILISAIVGLIVILCLFMAGKMSFKTLFHIEDPVVLLEKTQEMDGVTNISIDVSSSDISFSQSDSDSIEIVYKGPEKYKDDPDVEITNTDDTLHITQDKDEYVWGFSFTRRIIEVKIPASYRGAITIASSSGDIKLTGSYILAELSIKLTSGDVCGDDVTCETIYIKSSSGDFRFSSLEADLITLTHSSGNTNVDSIIGETKIHSSSGDTNIGTLTGKTKISVTSGDIAISDFSGYGEMKVSSGDIRVTVARSEGDVSIDTTSGDVKVTMGNDAAYSVHASCTCGDVSSDYDLDFSHEKQSATGTIGENPSDQLTIDTTSGDINIA